MAKRRRLFASPLPALAEPAADASTTISPDASPAPQPQTPPVRRPPIAEVAADSAASAALEAMAGQIERARREGRMIQALPLDAIAADYLVRDRLELEAEGQEALIASIRARGQQVPVEVVELEGGRHGLISGWRRLAALKRLHAETGEERFATALAILRRPADAPAAYLAMVEENEIRVGLSYYERARIVARAVEAGVFEGDTQALQTLFAAASRPRRSKIGSFLRIVRGLDAVLRFPAAIPERLGLRLAAALQDDAGLAGRIAAELRRRPPETATAELALLDRLADRPETETEQGAETVTTGKGAGQGAEVVMKPAPVTGDTGPATASEAGARAATEEGVSPGLPVVTYEPERGRITLTGPGIDAALARRLRAWLAEGQG